MQHKSSAIHYWLAAIHLYMSPIKFRRCLSLFTNIEELFSASEKTLQHLGVPDKEITLLKNPDWSAVEKTLRWCEASHCHLIHYHDDDYPRLLAETADAPLLLFVQGNKDLLSRPQIAMVGSRNPTASGYETAEIFAKYLAAAGFVITSGMALGIDAACHLGALASGETIAVMGTGLSHIYPSSHRKLAEQIIAKGALMSEFPPFVAPKAKNFPLRNRIISGLSLGVLVVEAALKSGSLITARNAVEQGREVFAIPGSIHNPLARGCHYLLRQGAKLVERAEDVVEELRAFITLFKQEIAAPEAAIKPGNLGKNAVKLLEQVGFETTAVDTIIARSGLTASEVSSILLFLELNGYVQTVPGGYARTSKKIP